MSDYKRNTEQANPLASRHSIGYRSSTPVQETQVPSQHGNPHSQEYHLWSPRYVDSGTKPQPRHFRCKKHADVVRGYASGTLVAVPGHQSSLTRTTSSSSAIWGSATLGRSPRLDRHLSGSYSTLGHSHSHRYSQHADHRRSNYDQGKVRDYGRQNEEMGFWSGSGTEKWARTRGVVGSNTPDVAASGLPPSGSKQLARHGRNCSHKTRPPDGTARTVGTEVKTSEVINVSKYTIPGSFGWCVLMGSHA
ncbi:hypothetical protein LSH36_284g03014 [Paralvinella palmiformis]|uniref:Uncharacterized protein n=1 Tax=Paralvinella palmiformis TaxID=53620 RepID=A0AAD9JIR2_9ANNE|nr:hypothetical protein LSH36_284g03014 [Paralvinella palmiformis]